MQQNKLIREWIAFVASEQFQDRYSNGSLVKLEAEVEDEIEFNLKRGGCVENFPECSS